MPQNIALPAHKVRGTKRVNRLFPILPEYGTIRYNLSREEYV